MSENPGFDQLGAGLGQMFSGLLGGMAQGLGNVGNQQNADGGAAANPFANLLGGAGGANGDGENVIGDLFSEAFKAQLSGKEVDEDAMQEKIMNKMMKAGMKTDPFMEELFSGEKKETNVSITAEDTLSPDKLNQEQVEYYGCYSNHCWDYDNIPTTILKIDFHGDGYFNDNFVHLLSANPRLSFCEVRAVDVRGCTHLTDVGLTWLARVLRDCPHLLSIELGGCIQVTERGVASLQQLASSPTLSLVGTGIALLPPSLLSEGTELQGCPLIQAQGKDEKETKLVSMGKLVVHQPEDAACSLSTLLTTKTKEPVSPLTYRQSWTCGGTDYSLLETSLNHPTSGLMRPEEASQVLVTVDLNSPQHTCVQHITEVVEYHMANSDSIVQQTKPLDNIIHPEQMFNASWDDANGRVLFFLGMSQFLDMMKQLKQFGLDEDDSFADDPEAISGAFLKVSLDRAHPVIEMMVECAPKTTMMLSVGVAHNTSGGDPSRIKVNNGDVIRFGIKNAEEMENSLLMDDNEHEFYLTVNTLDSDSPVCFISCAKGDESLREQVMQADTTFWKDEDEDSEKMSPDAMAALKGCPLFLCCMTNKYFQDAKCMQELEAASSLKKKIVIVTGSELDVKSADWVNVLDKLENAEVISEDEMDELENVLEKYTFNKQVDATFDGGSFLLAVASTEQGALKFLNHRPVNGAGSSSPCRELVRGPFEEIADHASFFDLSSGILGSPKRQGKLISVCPVSAENSEFSFRLKWTEECEKTMILGVSPDLEKLGEHPENISFDDETDLMHPFNLEESGQDLIRIVIQNLGPFAKAGAQYPVQFYRNDELVKEASFRWTLKDMSEGHCIPFFIVCVEEGTELHIMDYSPPAWFCAEMAIQGLMPDDCFLYPKHVASKITLTDTSIRFPNDSRQSVVMATSLTVHHPSFEIVVSAAPPEHTLCLVAGHYDIPEDLATNLASYNPEELEVGDVIRCSLEVEDLSFDRFGIPVPGQTVNLFYTWNGEVVKRAAVEYCGGGLHPALVGKKVGLTMKNMDIAKYQALTTKTEQPRKQFVVVGTSTKDSTGDRQEQLLSLKKATLQQLAQHQQEQQVVLDDVHANINPSFSGDLVQTRLNLQRENWAQLVKGASSMVTFTALNMDTLEGYDALCSLIQTNQFRVQERDAYRYHHTNLVRKTFDAILDKKRNPKILSGAECGERWGVQADQALALLRLLHQWGKVLLLEGLSPLVVILDLDWFVKVLQRLETTEPEGTVGSRVRSLHPDTRVWEDTQLGALAKDETLDDKKLLLSVLLKYHQLVRLTGPRASRDDTRSFLVTPRSLRQPDVSLSQFYDPEVVEEDLLTVKLTFRSPGTVALRVQRAVLAEAAQLTPPVLLAPAHLVAQLGAAQVVLVWQDPEREGVGAELVLVAKAFLPPEETASRDIVTEYCFTVAHLYEDVISHVLLTTHTPFVTSCQPQRHSANLSVCSSHRWSCEGADRQVSVCSLCANCSQSGMRCPFNQVTGPYHVHRCECDTHVVCCQDCGLCQHCAQSLWAICSMLRPCANVRNQMASRQVHSGTMSYTSVAMSPAIFNEATVVRTTQSDLEPSPDINIGLISEDGKRFVQLFPGRAVVGTKDQGYHQRTRKVITDGHVTTNPNLKFDIGDRVTVHVSEPLETSPEHTLVRTGEKDGFYAHLMYAENCSIARTTNTLRCRGGKKLGMAVSHLPASSKALYFDAEIISLSSEGFVGVGMTSTVNVADCMGHGTGHSLLAECSAWAARRWAVGHVVGCGTWLEDGRQVIGFTHNDQMVCKHVLPELAQLHAAVLVRPGQAVRLLRSKIWRDPKDRHAEAESQMPVDQEIFESDDGTVRISPKKTLLFERGIGDTQLPTSTIYIENNSPLYLLFKVRVNQQEGYISNPNRGIVRPYEVARITNECKTDDGDISGHRFQLAWIPLEDYEVPDDNTDLVKADEVWALKASQGVAEHHHKVNCDWMTGQNHAIRKETNFAEELDQTDTALAEPSYRVRVVKNDSEVGSYWLPKGSYKLAIEASGSGSEAGPVVQELVMLHLPRLPVEDARDSFRVGMRVNVLMEKDQLPDFKKAIQSVCENPRSVYAVCQVDKVERDDEGKPRSLRLSFHGTPSAGAPGKHVTFTLPVDSTRLRPVGRDVTTVSEDVSVSVNEEGVVQLVGLSPDSCREAPRHLFNKTGSKKETFHGTKCENLLFGAHMIHQFRDQLAPKAVLVSPTFVVLPATLNADTLRHPALRALHHFSAVRVHPVCQVMVNPTSQDWHLVDSVGFTPEGHLDYTVLYRNRQVMYNYLDLAAKKLKLPSYAKIVQVDKSMPRHQVEALLHSMLRTYALTAMLLAIPRYMKVAHVDLPEYRDWEPRAFLPLDFEDDSVCSTHPISGGLTLTAGPQAAHARHLAVVPTGHALPVTAAPDCFPVEPADLEKALTQAPWTETLTLDGPWEEAGRKVRLALPQLQRVVNTSECQVYVDNCPRLTHWEGSIMEDVAEQLKLLVRCEKLEKLVIHSNRIECLPEAIGGLRQLTTLHLTESHLSNLPEAFGSLKNLKDLSVAGPTAQWDKRSGLHVSLSDIKQKFPLLDEKKIQDTMKALLPNWNGAQTVVTSAQQRGKVLAAFYQLNASFGHKKEVGVHGGFPRQILQLTGLRHLRLAHQAIRTVPPQISRLANLETLELDGCMDLEVLPSTLGFLPLKKLSLQDCVSLRTPSREIVERGTESVSAYLKQMARGKSQNWRTKLMLVGIGGAGKTTLLRALRSNSHVAKATTEEQITHGIDIETWTARDEKRHPGVEVAFSAWDFAGQTVFYNTHQFFMSDRAVYLLVWSCRQGFDNSGLDFWLSSIQCHSPDTPVFVIATHADKLTTDLPQGQLKELYPQIKGFHFVGSTTGKGIANLKGAILDAAVELDYMGEDVPTVYLDLEKQLLSLRDEENPYMKWTDVKRYAMEAGIFDDKGVARAVQFLQQIGSVQYFDYELLRDYVVINPQWIVGAMASVVTFKDSVIKNGRLYHKHTAQLWKQYPKKLHEWLLRLTEMFDLTFQISKELSLVPCLLSNERPPEAKWPPSDQEEDQSAMLIIYAFRYLPTGLFNRLQARLFEFSKGKNVWKKGSILEKKGHYAFLMHERDQKLMVQVLGSHPENFLFLIHETLEDLIHRSYRGIQFEYQIPCPDCVREVGWDNPAMFEASLVREAAKCAAPYLQCRRLFHTVPMNTAKALMPPDDNQELDLQLQRSMQSLGEMRNGLKTDIFVLFTPADFVPDEARTTQVDPRMVVNRLKDDFTCFFDEKIDEADTQMLMVSMQEAKTLLVFISNQFVEDARCSQLLQYAYPIFKDRFFLVNLSPDYGWKSHTAGFILSQKIFVNMKKFAKDTFEAQFTDLRDSVRDKLGLASPSQEKTNDPVCFLSYAWNNSKKANALRKITKEEATACDPREIKERIEKELGTRCWLDVEQTGKRGLFEDITEGLRAADFVIAFASNEYVSSANCMMELRFAVSTLKIPVILVAVGLGMEWQYEELGTLQRNAKAKVIDMRREVKDGDMQELFAFIRSNTLTPEQREEKRQKITAKTSKMSMVELANISYQEEFELAQRKLMRRLTYLASHQSTIPYPRLFTLDFMDTETAKTPDAKPRPDSARKTISRRKSTLRRRDSVLIKQEMMTSEEDKLSLDEPLCIRYLCEHDQGWHATSEVLELRGLSVGEKERLVEQMAPYLARMMTLLKHSSVPLRCLSGTNGAAFKQYLVKLAIEAQTADGLGKAYIELLQYVIQQDAQVTRGGLKKCVLSGGRIRWLCPEHQKGYRVTVLTTDVAERASDQAMDTEYHKGVSEGLRQARGSASLERPAVNILDALTNASLDTMAQRFTGYMITKSTMFIHMMKTKGCEETFNMVKRNVKSAMEKGFENNTIEKELKKAGLMESVPEGAVPPTPAPRRPQSGRSTGSTGEMPAKKKVMLKESGRRVSVEQREAAQRMMMEMGQQQQGQQQNPTSQACTIL